MSKWVRLNEQDDVIVALEVIPAGSQVVLETGEVLNVQEEIPKSHKLATRFVATGNDVIKYGYSIGKASEAIVPGQWVHTHNLRTGLSGMLDYTYKGHAHRDAESFERFADPYADETLHFQGYMRANGDVGIRNEIWIINTVGCMNTTCQSLASQANQRFAGRVDGIYHFSHPYGCSQLGDDLQYTQKLLASLVNHPNAAAVLVVGLGCENNQIEQFRTFIADADAPRLAYMKAQAEEDELETGMNLLQRLVEYAETFERQPIPLSQLRIGLKCGGSDGLSGVTANPLTGRIADRIVKHGGTALLTEVPEMFGAEHILMNRAEDEHVFEQTVSLVNNFKQYFIRHGQDIYENPSPGNKAGGITTLEEKSLGCTQKGGHAPVTAVLAYGERSKRPGLNLVEGPGNDLVSVTALVAAGAHLVIFTTGRGTPFGGAVPTVKVSSNSELAGRKRNWIDFDAGQLLEGVSMDMLSDRFWSYLIEVASGRQQTCNERNHFREIAIFKDGVVL